MLLKGIFWTNNKKHGYIRGTIGGYLMYPSVAIFFIFQVLFLRVLTRALSVLSDGSRALDKKDYLDYRKGQSRRLRLVLAPHELPFLRACQRRHAYGIGDAG